MPTLLETQRAFAQSLLGPGPSGILPWVTDDDVPAEDRVSIYRNTFTGVVVAGLRITYPAVERLVGPEFFEGAARVFLAELPPKSAYLNDYGADFPEFLAGFRPAAALGYLPDVAALEWAVSCAVNAPDAPKVDPAALAQIDPDALEHLRLVAHPSVRMLELRTPADAIWGRLIEGDEDGLKGVKFDGGPFLLLIHRGSNGIVVRRLTTAEWRLSALLVAGESVAQSLALASGEDAIPMLAEHFACGRFTRAECLATESNPCLEQTK